MAAKASNNGIGKNNDLVWHLPADLKHFKKTTSGHYVIMGRKTFESLGRPLPGRLNIVITRNRNFFLEGAVVVGSLQEALDFASGQSQELVFILGGGEIYEQSMTLADILYITEVHHDFEGDTYFPEIDPDTWELIDKVDNKHEQYGHYSFMTFRRKANPKI